MITDPLPISPSSSFGHCPPSFPNFFLARIFSGIIGNLSLGDPDPRNLSLADGHRRLEGNDLVHFAHPNNRILFFGILPLEEVVFFFITNVLITFGMTLLLANVSQERFAEIREQLQSWKKKRAILRQ